MGRFVCFWDELISFRIICELREKTFILLNDLLFSFEWNSCDDLLWLDEESYGCIFFVLNFWILLNYLFRNYLFHWYLLTFFILSSYCNQGILVCWSIFIYFNWIQLFLSKPLRFKLRLISCYLIPLIWIYPRNIGILSN